MTHMKDRPRTRPTSVADRNPAAVSGRRAGRFLVGFGRRLGRGWMAFAKLLGTINRYVFMTVFYWVVIDLASLGARLARADLLDRRRRPQPSYWQPKPRNAGRYTNQF